MVRAGRAGVHAELGDAGPEDQPPAAGVDVRPAEDVAEERPCRVGVLGVDERVDGRDHVAAP